MPIRTGFSLNYEKKLPVYELFLYLCKDKNHHHGDKKDIVYKSRNNSLRSGK